jgi:hypothetical protein
MLRLILDTCNPPIIRTELFLLQIIFFFSDQQVWGATHTHTHTRARARTHTHTHTTFLVVAVTLGSSETRHANPIMKIFRVSLSALTNVHQLTNVRHLWRLHQRGS